MNQLVHRDTKIIKKDKFTTQRSTYIDPADGIVKRVPKINSKLINLNLNNAPALYNLGTFLLQDKKYIKAIDLLQKSINIQDSKEARLNMATCYKFLNNSTKAKSIMESIVKDYPDFPLAYNNLGLMKYDSREISQALSFYRSALKLKPDYGDAKWNYSLALNLQYFTDLEYNRNPPIQNFHLAMDYFESRFEKSNPVTVATHYGTRWQGQPLQPNEKIMLLCEQGFGDMVQFMRYAYQFPPGQAELHMPQEMHFLAKEGYSCTNSTEHSTCQYWSPMMSMAKYFPITNKPYINVPNTIPPKEIVESEGFKIGFCWKGNPAHENDRNRSRQFQDFMWLKDYGSLFSLQKDNKIKANWFKQLKLNHWVNTVAAINALDITVTVDTSIVHLCGAMDKPCIVLMPARGIDWRWGEVGENSVWYDSIRFARAQNMDEVKRLLLEFKSNGNSWGPRNYSIMDENESLVNEITRMSQEAIEREPA